MTDNYKFADLKNLSINVIPYLSNMGLFSLMRSLESIFEIEPKIGNETRYGQHHLRFGQSAYLSFQPVQVQELKKVGAYLNVNVYGFGLFGPNGPLPLHMSEYTYSKKLHQKEETFNDFLNIFHHRLISLFYKAWRSAQDIPSLDDRETWTFSRYVGSIMGVADQKDFASSIHIYDKFYYSGYFLNKNMPLSNLKSVLSTYFQTSVLIKENIGEWNDAYEFSTRLSYAKRHVLGQGLLIGDKIFDATQRFRITLGPLAPEMYLQFLQGNILAKKIVGWVEQYCRYQYQWDLEVIIDRHQIVQQTLGHGLSLGFTSWIGQPSCDPIVIIQY